MDVLAGILGVIIIFLIIVGILFFYLQYKVIQFIVVAVKLYKEMIQNQKRMIEILKRISSGEKTDIASNENFIKCPDCGTENEASSKFCENCGKPLNEVKTKTTSSDSENKNMKPEKIECTNCGNIIEISEEEIKKGSYFCPNCGTLNKIIL